MSEFIIKIGPILSDISSNSIYNPDVVYIGLIESGLHPRDHINRIRYLVNRFNNNEETFLVGTYSDYVIREINYLMLNYQLNKSPNIDPSKVKVIDEFGKIIEIDESYGIDVKSIDEVIDEQNSRLDEAFYNILYPSSSKTK